MSGCQRVRCAHDGRQRVADLRVAGEIRDEAAKPFDVPEILLLVERPIEAGEGPARQARADRKLRRPQQRQRRGSRELRRDELDDQIERRRGRFGRQRQRDRQPGTPSRRCGTLRARGRDTAAAGRTPRPWSPRDRGRLPRAGRQRPVLLPDRGESRPARRPHGRAPRCVGTSEARRPSAFASTVSSPGSQSWIRWSNPDPSRPVVATTSSSSRPGHSRRADRNRPRTVRAGSAIQSPTATTTRRSGLDAACWIRCARKPCSSTASQRGEALLVSPVRRGEKTGLPQQALGAAIVVGVQALRRAALRIDRRSAPAAGAGRRTASSRRRGRGAAETAVWRPCRPSARRRYAE